MSSPFHDEANSGEADGRDVSPVSEQLSQQPETSIPQALEDSAAATPQAEEPHFPVKCVLCGEEFVAEGDNGQLPTEALRMHMSSAHQNATASLIEQEPNDETPASVVDSEEITRLGPVEKLPDEQQEMTLEQRCLRLWNIHDVYQFTDDYDGEESGLPHLWCRMFDGFQRPMAYEKKSVARGEFLPVTNPDMIVDMLKDPGSHNSDELYALTANVAHILKIWQDEYLAIEKLRQRATESASKKKPRARCFEKFAVFEDKKESILYGYKHDPSENRIGRQDPFLQGGFAPTASQLAKMQEEAKRKGTLNIDGWTPVIKGGEEYIPMIGPEPPVVKKKKPTNARTKEEDSNAEGEKRVTRFGGSKHPSTRETSQAPSTPSSPVTGRGRAARSRAMSRTPQKASAQAPTSVPSSAAAPTTRRRRSITTTTTPAGASPATSAGPSRTATPYPDPLLDPKNQEKIRNSKNPKRTEAMILHWAKFNYEGRTRNPKRSKAQIEADKAAEREAAEKAANERKRRLESIREPGMSVFSIKKAKRSEKDTPGSIPVKSGTSNTPQPAPPSHPDPQKPAD
ncbi:hypothetical protein VTO42DRAFT_6866 [Malbranchea cinnamomea]